MFRQVRFDNLGWRGWVGVIVAGAVGLAAAIALIVLSLGLALVLVPLVAVGALYGRWRLRKVMAEAQAQQARTGDGKTIEIEYHVVDGDKRR